MRPRTTGYFVVTAFVVVARIQRFGIVVLAMPFDTWSAIAGSTIWMKMIMDFVLRRHAHTKFNKPGKKPEDPAAAANPEQK